MQPLEMPDPSSVITRKSPYADVFAVSSNEFAVSDDLLANCGGFTSIWKNKSIRFVILILEHV